MSEFEAIASDVVEEGAQIFSKAASVEAAGLLTELGPIAGVYLAYKWWADDIEAWIKAIIG
jgi:hypothetical protein